MKKLRNLRSGGVKACLISEALAIWSKKPSDIVYEVYTDYILYILSYFIYISIYIINSIITL